MAPAKSDGLMISLNTYMDGSLRVSVLCVTPFGYEIRKLKLIRCILVYTLVVSLTSVL